MNQKNLKFLVDVGVGKKVEKWLTNQGYDTMSVRDIDPHLPDREILKIAVSEKRTSCQINSAFIRMED
ncbi:MAG: DUF5615 family PIN-like protein [Planctomycetia bacterium]|nr:DUF5615 family PIN-like protein [Planctomycetia bacterium]